MCVRACVCARARVCVCPKIGIDLTPSEAIRAPFFLITCNSYVAYVRTFEVGAPFTQSPEIIHCCKSDKNMQLVLV